MVPHLKTDFHSLLSYLIIEEKWSYSLLLDKKLVVVVCKQRHGKAEVAIVAVVVECDWNSRYQVVTFAWGDDMG